MECEPPQKKLMFKEVFSLQSQTYWSDENILTAFCKDAFDKEFDKFFSQSSGIVTSIIAAIKKTSALVLKGERDIIAYLLSHARMICLELFYHLSQAFYVAHGFDCSMLEGWDFFRDYPPSIDDSKEFVDHYLMPIKDLYSFLLANHTVLKLETTIHHYSLSLIVAWLSLLIDVIERGSLLPHFNLEIKQIMTKYDINIIACLTLLHHLINVGPFNNGESLPISTFKNIILKIWNLFWHLQKKEDVDSNEQYKERSLLLFMAVKNLLPQSLKALASQLLRLVISYKQNDFLEFLHKTYAGHAGHLFLQSLSSNHKKNIKDVLIFFVQHAPKLLYKKKDISLMREIVHTRLTECCLNNVKNKNFKNK